MCWNHEGARKLSGIILASGFSHRMHTEKLLLPVGGIPLVERVVRAALPAGLDELLLIYQHAEVARIAQACSVRAVYNAGAHEGLSAAVRLGVTSARPDTEGFLFLVGDQPYLSTATIKKLRAAFQHSSRSIIVPVYAGRRGNPVIFPAALREELLALQGDTGGRSIIERMPHAVLTVPLEDGREGMDIDTPQHYRTVPQ